MLLRKNWGVSAEKLLFSAEKLKASCGKVDFGCGKDGLEPSTKNDDLSHRPRIFIVTSHRQKEILTRVE